MHRVLLVCAVALGFLIKFPVRNFDYFIELKEKSEFGLEDLDGRLAYEQMLTANPSTGRVPNNIRSAELAFARQIDVRNTRLRTQALDIASEGPFNVGGRTRAVALDVRDENIIIAGGVSGGIWKSIDGGATWVRKSDPENRNSVTCLVQDVRPGHEDTWYHGTGELFGNTTSGGSATFRGNGIYRSTDNGETWNVIPSTVDSEPSVFNSQFQYIWDIVINESNLVEDEILVAAFGAILRSLDGGNTWMVEVGQELFNLDPSIDLNDINASFFTSLERTSNGLYFASLSTFSSPDPDSPNAGIYVSQDGDNWTDIAPFTAGSQYRRVVMGHAPSLPSRCFFLIDSSPTFLLRYDLSGFNSGGQPVGSWTNLADNVPAFGGELGDFDSQGSFNMILRVDPNDPNTVFLGGTNLYRSTDGFASSENTSWIGGYNPEGGSSVYLNHHPDQHEVIFFDSDPDKLISANDGGLMITNDFNADSIIWESINSGYVTTQFYTIALSQEENDDFMLGGMQDNGTDITSGSGSWSGVIGGDGGYTETTPGKSLWFASFQRGQTFRITLNSDLETTSFARVDPEGLVNAQGSSYLFINPFIIDPTNPNRMFIGGGNYLYVNQNVSQIPGGSQEGSNLGWKRLDDSRIDFGVVSAMDISIDGATLYVGSSDGLVRKVTNANNELEIAVEDVTGTIFPDNAYISSISINPDDTGHLLVVFSNYEVQSVFESTDGGSSYTDVSGNLEQFPDGSGNGPSVRWCEIIPKNGGDLYLVGTSTGLYATETTDGTSTNWVKESPELIGSAVITMMDYRTSDGRLAIASHGNGVFTTNIADFKSLDIVRESEDFQLLAAYPNPFNQSTRIEYSIPEDGIVRVDLFSAKGEMVRNLLWGPQFSGTNSITWDGTNESGTTVTNGIYLYRIRYKGGVKTGRISLRN